MAHRHNANSIEKPNTLSLTKNDPQKGNSRVYDHQGQWLHSVESHRFF